MSERRFRRPAMLDPEEAEEIVGDADPAGDAEVAHTSAWALLGVPGEDFDEEHVAKLRETVRAQGVDVVAALWDKSPAFTLPGALWRLYLLWQWNQINPDIVAARFAEGIEVLQKQDRPVPEPLDQTMRAVGGVLAGYATEDELAPVLSSAATAMRVMATGITYGPEWILEDRHQLAHPVTRRPQALLETASELEQSASLAVAGTLD